MDQLEGKVVIVTGGASGIGLAVAHRFAAEGARLVLADIEAPALDEASASFAPGAEVVTVVTDVSEADQVDALRDRAIEAFGAVHVVCNNAGVGGGGPMQDLTLSDWDWVLGVNLWGVIHGVRTFLPHLLEQGEGHIVNTASVAGLYSAPFMGPYNVSKYGVVSLSETLAVELAMAESPVGVSVLCPSWVKTNIATSTRNRPDDGSAPTAEEQAGIAAIVEHFLTTGMEATDVAEHVVEAVRTNTFWILTHDETPGAVEQRTRAILERAAPPLLMH
ncbi:SDR family NAD(P)-dependent oxidoreductase [Rhabdothermincola salaria]|uniref:SDR family NAD(P)-dependent oxidoreductase n=1 Tax=Rhabdothermincola salaria TaxID=2903142 RepID=UPI001E559688|nr:SDR family NAD(P)-dependent oxidoreductase [Rhabdothermincola salaria]MCD9623323.1 SDR family NAD(P)-dependent oxidoreductase [Rhabdothermincola salaria]